VSLALEDAETAPAAAQVLDDLGPLPGRVRWASTEDAVAVLRTLDPEWDGALPTTLLLAADGTVALAQRGITKLPELEKAIDGLGRLASSETDPPAVGIDRKERKRKK
jgi:hypothetical protein